MINENCAMTLPMVPGKKLQSHIYLDFCFSLAGRGNFPQKPLQVLGYITQ